MLHSNKCIYMVVLLSICLIAPGTPSKPNIIIVHPDDMYPGYGGSAWSAPDATPAQNIRVLCCSA